MSYTDKLLVGIVMGSDSDLALMQEAANVLDTFDVQCELIISSAHRSPDRTARYARTAEERGIEVIIAGAGMAAHLPGVIASMTPLPVIGVPIKSGALNGVDSLYAIVQMPTGVPVATMAINGAKNAALFAVQILSAKYPELREKFKKYKQNQAMGLEAKDARLAENGSGIFLKDK